MGRQDHKSRPRGAGIRAIPAQETELARELELRYKEAMNLFDANFLFASLIWGSIGLGYCIYGKRQQSWVPMVAGVLMIAVSYFVGSALLMSLICAALIVAVYVLLKQGY